MYICILYMFDAMPGFIRRRIRSIYYHVIKMNSNENNNKPMKVPFFCPFEIYGMIKAGAHTFMPPGSIYICKLRNHWVEYMHRTFHSFCMFSDSVLFSYRFCCFFFHSFILERALRSLRKHSFCPYLCTFAFTINRIGKYRSYTYANIYIDDYIIVCSFSPIILFFILEMKTAIIRMGLHLAHYNCTFNK